MSYSIIHSLRTLLLALVLSIGISYAYAAWSPPGAAQNPPPNGNIDVPVNVGTTYQSKTGGFDVANTLSAMNGIFTGSVGIGVASPTEKLEVNGNVKATSFFYSSDERLKKDIIGLNGALEKILNLQGVQFKWKNSDDNEHIGFIAQEVEKVVPQVVKTGSDGFKSVEYGNIVPLLVEAIKEQQKEIDLLKTEIEMLKSNR